MSKLYCEDYDSRINDRCYDEYQREVTKFNAIKQAIEYDEIKRNSKGRVCDWCDENPQKEDSNLCEACYMAELETWS